jgi:hypothetical protein
MTALYLLFPLCRTYGIIQNFFKMRGLELSLGEKEKACSEKSYEIIK